MAKERFISVVIPNYNGAATIGRCLEAVFVSRYKNFEAIVVDDCSSDGSVEIIRRHPCALVALTTHAGASGARNAGAERSAGEFLFFIDADCLLRENTLALVNEALEGNESAVIGGTYTLRPADDSFFSSFQSAFIHYSETRKKEPDYIATHAFAIRTDLFRQAGGFKADFLPILEDVEFSHRLRKQGYRLIMRPEIQVGHIFNFTLSKSIRNAFRKSRFWTVYSLGAGDLFADSGTASHGMKANGAALLLSGALFLLWCISGWMPLLMAIPIIELGNLWMNRTLLRTFVQAGGIPFASAAAFYYITLYPAAALAGALAGSLDSRPRGHRRRAPA